MTIASPEELMATQAKNATLAYGLMGGTLGLLLGLGGGLARSTVQSAAVASVVGLALGAAAGAGATLAMVPLYHRFQDARQEMASMDITVPLLIHSAIWAAAGAAAGLAFGLGAREGRRRLLQAGARRPRRGHRGLRPSLQGSSAAGSRWTKPSSRSR